MVDTRVRKLEMRACDHQLMLPMMLGMAKKNPKFKDYLVATKIMTINCPELLPTCREMMEKR